MRLFRGLAVGMKAPAEEVFDVFEEVRRHWIKCAEEKDSLREELEADKKAL